MSWIRCTALCFGLLFILGCACNRHTSAEMKNDGTAMAADNIELAQIFSDDQADRKDWKAINWQVIQARDREREGFVKDLHNKGLLKTGMDYYHAAMILQHAEAPEDYLLAHEFCILALSKGRQDALWLAAATEDRYLMNVGKPQRFATQYQKNLEDGNYYLYQVDPSAGDALRTAFGLPTLPEAKEKEKLFN